MAKNPDFFGSLLPVPCSLLPVACCLFPVPCSLFIHFIVTLTLSIFFYIFL
ncbi:MAG: hypothetical protein F6K56_21520 [Moorea sp. SIO3G5]|nr:hypothetical protein [Moorena sp. SIO3G5]